MAGLGLIGAALSGLISGAIYTVAPAAGVVAGLTDPQVAALMAAFIGGGLVLQLPLAKASDAFDRRQVRAAIGGLVAVFGFGPVGFFAVLTAPGAVLAFASMRKAQSSDRLPAAERSDAVAVRPTSAVLVALDPRFDPEDWGSAGATGGGPHRLRDAERLWARDGRNAPALLPAESVIAWGRDADSTPARWHPPGHRNRDETGAPRPPLPAA